MSSYPGDERFAAEQPNRAQPPERVEPAPPAAMCKCGHTSVQHSPDDGCIIWNCVCGSFRPTEPGAPAPAQEWPTDDQLVENGMRIVRELIDKHKRKAEAAPAAEPPDTYTALLWATLDEDARWVEYIRVRTELTDARENWRAGFAVQNAAREKAIQERDEARDAAEQLRRERDEAHARLRDVSELLSDAGVLGGTIREGVIELRNRAECAEEDAEDSDGVRSRLADLLERVALAFNGTPPPLTLWDWSDLPLLAQQHVEQLEAARAALAERERAAFMAGYFQAADDYCESVHVNHQLSAEHAYAAWQATQPATPSEREP